ncbi:hypothetical protein IAU59_006538 [Kwoniella sp. CBS 9459]
MLRALDLLGNLNCVYHHHNYYYSPLRSKKQLASVHQQAPTLTDIPTPTPTPIAISDSRSDACTSFHSTFEESSQHGSSSSSSGLSWQISSSFSSRTTSSQELDRQVSQHKPTAIASPYFTKSTDRPDPNDMRTRSQSNSLERSEMHNEGSAVVSDHNVRVYKKNSRDEHDRLFKRGPISPPITPLSDSKTEGTASATGSEKRKRGSEIVSNSDADPTCAKAGRNIELEITEGGVEVDQRTPVRATRRRRTELDDCRPPTPESLPRRNLQSFGDSTTTRVEKKKKKKKNRMGSDGDKEVADGGDWDGISDQGRVAQKGLEPSRKEMIVEIPITRPKTRTRKGKSIPELKHNRSVLEEAPDTSSEINAPKRKPKKVQVKIAGHGLIDGDGVSKSGTDMGESGAEVLAKSEKGVMESVGKIHLIQEKLRYDPWKMLVATSLLNKTSGRAARPVLEILLERWPSAKDLAEASIPDLAQLLYPLGLFNQRAASLVRFSRQYLDLGWPIFASSSHPLQTSDLPPLPLPSLDSSSTPDSSNLKIPHNPFSSNSEQTALDVKVFHGSGVYASDSFRIFSQLLPGRGGPEQESIWLEKRTRALEKMRAQGVDWDGGVEMLGDWFDDDDCRHGRADAEVIPRKGEGFEEEEWRKVRPNDKELRRYLIWRWGIEGIVYDIHNGPRIVRGRDQARLSYLLDPPSPSPSPSSSSCSTRPDLLKAKINVKDKPKGAKNKITKPKPTKKRTKLKNA